MKIAAMRIHLIIARVIYVRGTDKTYTLCSQKLTTGSRAIRYRRNSIIMMRKTSLLSYMYSVAGQRFCARPPVHRKVIRNYRYRERPEEVSQDHSNKYKRGLQARGERPITIEPIDSRNVSFPSQLAKILLCLTL
jgi:hypothetical protein